jgi:hypothetical protein
LLGEQDNLGLSELQQLEPAIYNSLRHIGAMEHASDFEDLSMVSFFEITRYSRLELYLSRK